MRIGKREIGAGHVYIVAELSGNHNQSFDLAVETVKAAATTGADAIKLQTYTADTITLNVSRSEFMARSDGPWAGQSLYSLYQKAHTPWEWHGPLQSIARECGLDFFSSPFDSSAVELLAGLDVPAYKIASFEVTDIPLIDYVARQGKPVIISTGIADESDIRLALDTCYQAGNREVILLKCTSEYPASPEDANLNTMTILRERFGVPVGLSDHSPGSVVPVVSVGLGAVLIEKHLMLDRSLGVIDSAFSLDVNEFREMVDAVRLAESTLGVGTLELTPEMKKSRASARSLYVTQDVRKGDEITPRNLRSVRPGHGLHTKYYGALLGKHFASDVSAGTAMSMDLVEEDVPKSSPCGDE